MTRLTDQGHAPMTTIQGIWHEDHNVCYQQHIMMIVLYLGSDPYSLAIN